MTAPVLESSKGQRPFEEEERQRSGGFRADTPEGAERSSPRRERAHALLSASSAHRWLHCTPSARLEDTLPDSQSSYAAAGTLAHAIAELRLRKEYKEPMGPRKYANALKKLKEDPHYDPEMDRAVEAYYDHIATIVHAYDSPPYIALERRMDYSHIAPEGFGTCDCLIIHGRDLHVVDYKNGTAVGVSAEQNAQMMLYALGALREFGFLYPIECISLSIVQPHNQQEPLQWWISREELEAWGESVKPIAEQAYRGEGEQIAGDWCRFCRAKGSCRARAAQMMELEGFATQDPRLLSLEEIGRLIERARAVTAWAKDLEAHALQECLAGNAIPGYKAVEGRRVREFTDMDAAFAALQARGVAEAILYERKPLTLAQLEKTLGKKEFNEALATFVAYRPGSPTLVPETDKREAITGRTTAAEDFGPLADAASA